MDIKTRFPAAFLVSPPVVSGETAVQPLDNGVHRKLMRLFQPLAALVIGLQLLASMALADQDPLFKGFSAPPQTARPITYWWWQDGNISKEGISADLKAFKEQGVGGVLLFDATQFRDPIPLGKYGFMTPGWNEMFQHTVSEASRLGLTVSLNPTSGYCYGGAWADRADGGQQFFWVETKAKGGAKFEGNVFSAQGKNLLNGGRAAKLVAVMAVPEPSADAKSAEIRGWRVKAGEVDLLKEGGGSLLKREFVEEDKPDPGEWVLSKEQVIDLTSRVDAQGNLAWDAPSGDWVILAMGHQWNGVGMFYPSKVAKSGPHANYLDPKVTEKGFVAVVDNLRNQLKPEIAGALHYLHEDSVEDHFFNWSSDFTREFLTLRGYDPTPYLPVMAGRVVGSREISNRFLADLRKTIGDMVADNHYGRLTQLAHTRGLETHLQAGGPHLLMIDPLKCLGRADIPMGEFWALSPHRPADDARFYVKLQSSAAHIYGKRRVLVESFSGMGQMMWKDSPFDLKDCLNRAFCEGANWLAFMDATARADLSKIPGDTVGSTPFTPTLTFWKQAGDWFSYMSRCSYLLQQGLFVGDLAYYYGDQVPNQLPRKKIDPARGPGYDYDAMSAEVLTESLSVKEGRLILPDGVSYRLLVLPERTQMPLEILQKLKTLVQAGAVVAGPRPKKAAGLQNYPQADAEVERIGKELWGDCDGKQVKQHQYGQGKVYWGVPPREILADLGVVPDFTYALQTPPPQKWPATEPMVDFIHRRDGETEIYFVINRTAAPMKAQCQFRVSGKQPELWNPVTAGTRDAAAFSQGEGVTSLPLEFEPYESVFVVFRRAIPPNAKGKAVSQEQGPEFIQAIPGPWAVSFDPHWGPFSAAEGKRPGEFVFDELLDWTKHPDAAVKYYSGTATYRKEFLYAGKKPAEGEQLWIDLGPDLKNVAEIRLNGKRVGVLWCPPWRLDITKNLVKGTNKLEIDVANLWTNRLIGDSGLPEEKRFTRTNGRTSGPGRPPLGTYTPETPLFASGLLGPVTIQVSRFGKPIFQKSPVNEK